MCEATVVLKERHPAHAIVTRCTRVPTACTLQTEAELLGPFVLRRALVLPIHMCNIIAVSQPNSSRLQIPGLAKPRLYNCFEKVVNICTYFLQNSRRGISKGEPPQSQPVPYEVREVQNLEVHCLVLAAHIWAKLISWDDFIGVQRETQNIVGATAGRNLHQGKELARTSTRGTRMRRC